MFCEFLGSLYTKRCDFILELIKAVFRLIYWSNPLSLYFCILIHWEHIMCSFSLLNLYLVTFLMSVFLCSFFLSSKTICKWGRLQSKYNYLEQCLGIAPGPNSTGQHQTALGTKLTTYWSQITSNPTEIKAIYSVHTYNGHVRAI